MSRKFLYFIPPAFCLAFIFYFYSFPADEEQVNVQSEHPMADSEPVNPTKSEPKVSLSQSVKTFDLESRVSEIQSRRGGQAISKESIEEILASDEPVWKELLDTPESLSLTEEEKRDGREFLSLNTLKIETLIVGDQLPLEVPQLSSEYQLTVKNVDEFDSTVSWSGSVEGVERGRFRITRGDKLTVGSILTEAGTYEFQFFGDEGWIVSADTLIKFPTPRPNDTVELPN